MKHKNETKTIIKKRSYIMILTASLFVHRPHIVHHPKSKKWRTYSKKLNNHNDDYTLYSKEQFEYFKVLEERNNDLHDLVFQLRKEIHELQSDFKWICLENELLTKQAKYLNEYCSVLRKELDEFKKFQDTNQDEQRQWIELQNEWLLKSNESWKEYASLIQQQLEKLE